MSYCPRESRHRFIKRAIPIGIIVLISLYPLIRKFPSHPEEKEIEREKSVLPTSARDVIVLGIDFSQYRGDVFTRSNIEIIADIDRAFQELEGIRKYSSLLNTTVVTAMHDEIMVLPFISAGPVDSWVPADMTLTSKSGDKRVLKVLAYQKKISENREDRLFIFTFPPSIEGTGLLVHS